METTEEQLRRMFGENGLNNLKEHAKSVNLSLASFVFMANFEPSQLARMMQAAIEARRQPPRKPQPSTGR